RARLPRAPKPANALLARPRDPQVTGAPADPGVFQVADFRLPRVTEGGTGATGGMPGGARYTAPEEAAGRADQVGPHTDVYALGVLLYELLTGRHPFQGATDLETLQRVVTEQPTPPRLVRPDVPADLEAICLKCLAKEPAGRYASAGALAEDLRNWCGPQPGPPERPS